MPTDELIQSVQRLSSKELESLLQKRQAEDKALRVLLRAAVAREREERHQQREVLPSRLAPVGQTRKGVASA
jgi:Arc/MetJ family transcription regulator